VSSGGTGLPPITDVSGGAGGTDARLEDILALAGLFDTAGDGLRGDAWEDKGLLLDGDLVASALLSPGTFAEAELEVLAATYGPDGLAVRAVGVEAVALVMETGVQAYRNVDELSRQVLEGIDYAIGYTIGAALPVLLVGGVAVVAANPAVVAFLAANPAARDALVEDGLAGLQGFLEDNPDLVQHLVNGGGGLMDGLGAWLPPDVRVALFLQLGIDPLHPTTNDAALDLAALFRDGDHDVVPGEGHDLAPPDSVEELMENLSETNGGEDGGIDIQVVGEPPNQRYIVNLPGTDDWVGDPGDARDLGSNLRLVGGEDTVYSRGIQEAMREAGVPPGADVMLVGHSQGGMTAVNLAADPDFRDDYNVRHVVTAGAPTAQVPHIPDSTQVLSLENTGDVVPLTDGEDNPDQPNRTTVRFDNRTGSIGDNHSMDLTYTPGGAAVDASDDPSIVESIEQMRQDGFLGAESSETSGWTITRR
jgi:hypothetical protein